MSWISKEMYILIAAIICCVIAAKLDIWNYMFVYWLIRIYTEMTEGK